MQNKLRYFTGNVITASSPPNEDGFSDKLSTTPTSTDSSSPSPSPGFTVNHSKVSYEKTTTVKQIRRVFEDNLGITLRFSIKSYVVGTH